MAVSKVMGGIYLYKGRKCKIVYFSGSIFNNIIADVKFLDNGEIASNVNWEDLWLFWV